MKSKKTVRDVEHELRELRQRAAILAYVVGEVERRYGRAAAEPEELHLDRGQRQAPMRDVVERLTRDLQQLQLQAWERCHELEAGTVTT